MAASDVSDIPDDKPVGKYCVCNNCKISREEGRQEIRERIRAIHTESDGKCLQCTEAETGGDEFWIEWHAVDYPCPTIEALDNG